MWSGRWLTRTKDLHFDKESNERNNEETKKSKAPKIINAGIFIIILIFSFQFFNFRNSYAYIPFCVEFPFIAFQSRVACISSNSINQLVDNKQFHVQSKHTTYRVKERAPLSSRPKYITCQMKILQKKK